jgi:hypothetical protein
MTRAPRSSARFSKSSDVLRNVWLDEEKHAADLPHQRDDTEREQGKSTEERERQCVPERITHVLISF